MLLNGLKIFTEFYDNQKKRKENNKKKTYFWEEKRNFTKYLQEMEKFY